jgi:hypothetical protein
MVTYQLLCCGDVPITFEFFIANNTGFVFWESAIMPVGDVRIPPPRLIADGAEYL